MPNRQLSLIERWAQEVAAAVNADRVGECLTDNLRRPSRHRYSVGKCRCAHCYAAYKASKATRQEVDAYLEHLGTVPDWLQGFTPERLKQTYIESDPWGHTCRRALAEAYANRAELSATTDQAELSAND
jgi:hypothetical protein